jgi:hypothetical protein
MFGSISPNMRVMVSTVPSDSRTARMAELYGAGKSIREVAVACAASPKTVHRRLTAANVPLRPPGGVKGRQAAREPLTAEEEQAAAATYRDDRPSLHDLGAAYGVSGDTMGRRLRARGVPLRPRGRRAESPPQPSADVLRLHDQGLPPRAIAAQLRNADAAAIAEQLRAAGHSPHRGGHIPAGAELAAAWAAAGSVRALARQYQVAEYRVRAALRDQGIPRPAHQQATGATSSGIRSAGVAPPDEAGSREGLPRRARVA